MNFRDGVELRSSALAVLEIVRDCTVDFSILFIGNCIITLLCNFAKIKGGVESLKCCFIYCCWGEFIIFHATPSTSVYLYTNKGFVKLFK